MEKKFRFIVLIFSVLLANAAVADAGHAYEWQMVFQDAATPVMEKLHHFHNWLLVMCFGIASFVAFLLLYVCYRFSAKRNPIPSKTTHNLALEIVWTTIPVMILLVMAVPSFNILYFADKVEEADFTLKVVGRQWYWQYEYPDHGNIAFDSYIVNEEDLLPGQLRLLEVDNRVVLPINTNIKVLVTSGDVVHSWAVPSFGIKTDAVPGRTNETWINIQKEGVYYGQCSELCGTNHGFMPIAIEAVSKEKFEKWITEAGQKFASNSDKKIAFLGR